MSTKARCKCDGCFNGMQIVLGDMKKNNCGTIINILSIVGIKRF